MWGLSDTFPVCHPRCIGPGHVDERYATSVLQNGRVLQQQPILRERYQPSGSLEVRGAVRAVPVLMAHHRISGHPIAGQSWLESHLAFSTSASLAFIPGFVFLLSPRHPYSHTRPSIHTALHPLPTPITVHLPLHTPSTRPSNTK